MNKMQKRSYLLVDYLCIFLMFIGGIILLPLIVLIFYPEEIIYAKNFILPGVFTIFLGYLGHKLLKGNVHQQLEKHEDALLVVMVWLVAILFASLPFFLTKEYNIVQSLFEVTSGFSTTGLSVVDVANAPHIYLLFRSLLLFFGGIGLVLVFTSAVSDKYGMRLYYAEGHNDKLLPNLIRSARLILSIYTGYIILGSVLFIIFGMPVFDAINHSIASVSTGGFSTQVDSIGHYNSFAIEIVTMILMLLGGTNFLIHILLIRRKFYKVFSHIETKLFLVLCIIFIPILIITIGSQESLSLSMRIRVGLFQFISAITTTGFQTITSFAYVPVPFYLSIILLMLVGGGLGSTAGGIKQYRVAMMLKQIYWNLRDRLSHKRVVRTLYTNRAGKEEVVKQGELQYNQVFISVYLMVFMLGVFIFTLYGYSISSAMFEFASAMGTVGLSTGIIGYDAPTGILLTTMIGMFLGRLEFFIVWIAIGRIYFRMKKR